MKVDVHYVITNNGDGSASVRWCKNALEAELYDEWRQRNEGWGENEDFHETLEFDENGQQLHTLNLRETLEEEIVWHKKYPDSYGESSIEAANELLSRLAEG